MKTKRTTKSALISSVLALFLCITMLLGTTYAWFTDSVESANNIIKSGNLDVELYHTNDKDTREKVDNNTKLFDDIALWEPGAVVYETFEIVNEGSLALKYLLSVNVTNAIANANGNTLSDILKVGVIKGGATSTDRAALISEVKTWAALTSFNEAGNLVNQNDNAVYTVVIYWEPSANDNDYNMNNGKGNPLTLDIGVTLLATQYTAESDSFDDQYDAGAALPWSGKIDTEWFDATETEFVLYSAEQLAGLAELVNNGNSLSGKTVKLGTDLDLANRAWTPIGACNTAAYFQGTFDGQGYTIYGLNVDNSTDEYMYSTAGLFGWVDAAAAVVQNVNLDHATVKGSHWVGGIAGFFTGDIINCSVSNSTIIGYNVNDDANGDKVGAIVGYMNSYAGKLDGNKVTDTTVTGYRDIAAVAGAVAVNNTVTNNKAENVVITYSSGSVGELVSTKTAVKVDETNVATNVKIIKAVSASTAEDLSAALTDSENKNISIVLSDDVDLPITSLGTQTPGSGQYKLGGADTETITIDLNGHRLNITTTYWSVLGAVNPDAVFTIKNGTMTSSQTSGTWNSYDLCFDDCQYVIENVVFEKAIAIETDAVLTNVKINESHDYYALWISADGQTVEIDGLTINSAGRGIKIDEQYVDAPAKVTLSLSNAKVNSVNKAAIMVKSAAGADITLEKVDISNAKADYVHEVWVDSDATEYANLVTVTGGDKANEADIATKSSELDAMLKAGKTDILLAGGTFIIPDSAQHKTLTLTGLGDTVIAAQNDGASEGNGDYSFDGSTVTFNNLTIKIDATYFPGFPRMKGVYNNCMINGVIALYDDAEFNGCTFNVSGDIYNVWTWGAPNATFNNCTFNSDGKALLLYGTANTKLTVNDCTFNDKGGLTDKKAAIEIGNDYGKTYTLIVNNTVVNGYEINDKGVNTGTTLFGDKNSMLAKGTLTVIVDGYQLVFSEQTNKTPAPLEEDFLFPAGTNAVMYKDVVLTGDAQIVHTENAVLGLSNVKAELDHDVIVRKSGGAICIENSDFTLTNGAKLISVGEGGDAYQVFLINVTVNGVLLTQENAGQYLEGISWFGAYPEWPET